MPVLNVCIPSIVERGDKLQQLISYLEDISQGFGVKILYAVDNKEMSIGAKRQLLLNNCDAEYMMMLDDDDTIPDDYFQLVIPELTKRPDCIGYYEEVKNSKGLLHVKHSVTCGKWTEKPLQRTPFYKTPIRTELAKAIGFEDKRFGEDHTFALSIYPLLRKEIFIDKAMYIYNQPDPMTKQQHNKRYGIR